MLEAVSQHYVLGSKIKNHIEGRVTETLKLLFEEKHPKLTFKCFSLDWKAFDSDSEDFAYVAYGAAFFDDADAIPRSVEATVMFNLSRDPDASGMLDIAINLEEYL